MSGDNNNSNNVSDYGYITTDNVEDELKKLKIIDNYDSDEYEHDKICLTTSGIDIKALKAGKDIEWSVDTNEKDYDFEDERDNIDYEQVFKHRNMEVIGGVDDMVDDSTPHDSKTPFEVLRAKMADITPEKSGGVIKRVLTPGFGLPLPKGSHVRVHYNAYFEMNDEPFDSTYLRNKSFQFKLGANEVVIGLDIGVSTMKRKEKAQFIFEPEYYCGKFGCEPRVPKETPVLFEVEVISVLELGPLDEFNGSTDEERRVIPFSKVLQICNCLRTLGNDCYQRKNHRDASHHYRKAIYVMENKSTDNDEDDARHRGILLKLYLNMSQVSLNQSKPKKCIYYCKLALNIEPNQSKALYRYGKALRTLQDFERSRNYLLKALKLEPTNKEIRDEIEKLDEMIKTYKLVEKKMCKRMFSSGNDENNNEDPSGAFKPNGKNLNEETKKYITDKIQEFASDSNKQVYKIQADYYPEEMINFIKKQSESIGLSTRLIKGNTNILQVLKDKI